MRRKLIKQLTKNVLGSSRMNAWEMHIIHKSNKNSKEVKIVKRADFHELKSYEKNRRETNEGKADKFMMMVHSKNIPKKATCKVPLNCYYQKDPFIIQIKKEGNVRIYKEEVHSRLIYGHDTLTDSQAVEASYG